ncbi:putative protein, putative transcriptional regulator (zinc finger domain) [Campylobacter iguaniorum]|uniref:Transcription factor zinc-finger domain-containing protein n=1 Tax=Campylobacter iguaniorum TaxID=1244531 RepID=A0A076FBS8_9BACT|nr:zf-TFIIB domain-containing protein [Campylobacter iguaniorum]AII15143.1 hypothetical protein, putative transcriptional regulator (zinc finger domain) [Campylobacter iguaniorum]ALV25010.1 putative protein, putative transcriptional regulator (zinc finger domain) [Campylobacter iguaniorum]
MKCPVCKDLDLVMSERSGVEIDYCPSCRGVWLDRGELDKILERSATPKEQPREYFNRSNDGYKDERRYDDKRYDNGYHKGYPHKKKESFLSELFDF